MDLYEFSLDLHRLNWFCIELAPSCYEVGTNFVPGPRNCYQVCTKLAPVAKIGVWKCLSDQGCTNICKSHGNQWKHWETAKTFIYICIYIYIYVSMYMMWSALPATPLWPPGCLMACCWVPLGLQMLSDTSRYLLPNVVPQMHTSCKDGVWKCQPECTQIWRSYENDMTKSVEYIELSITYASSYPPPPLVGV